MPISKYNPDGTVDIYNSRTGEVKNKVKPEELINISPKLVAEYQAGQAPEKVVERTKAQKEIETFKEAEEAGVPTETIEARRKSEAAKEKDEDIILGFTATLGDLKKDAQRLSIFDPLKDILGGNVFDTQKKMFSQRKKLASQFLAKMVEKNRLSDQDRKFYQKEIANISAFGRTEPKNKAIDRISMDVIRLSGYDPTKYGFATEELLVGGNGQQRRIPVLSQLLGVGQDIGVGAALGGQERDIARSEAGALRGARQAEIRARTVQEPEQKRRLLEVAGGAREVVGRGARERQQMFSPDIEQPYLGRGLETGVNVALLAELPALFKAIPGLARKGTGVARGGYGKLAELLKPKPAAISESALVKGLKAAEKGKKVRNVAISKAQTAGKKVDGTKVYNIIKKKLTAAKSGLSKTQAKEADELIKRANKYYKGKNLTPTKAKSRWDFARRGYSQAGKKGETVLSEYHRAIRDGVRKELDKVAPGFEKGTQAIRKGLEEEKILKTVRIGKERGAVREALKETPSPVAEFGKRVGRKAIDLGALYTLLRILGIGSPRRID